MAQIPWSEIRGEGRATGAPRRYGSANVKFFNAYPENVNKSLEAGRPIFDTIPSISIQFPGMDETVRKIERRDQEDYPELYKNFIDGSSSVTSGTPLIEWSLMPGSTLREFQHQGFNTVEQLAEANDDVKRRMGPQGHFVKKAKDWLAAANTPQNLVVGLREALERERLRTQRLEDQLELLLQRVDANEGGSLSSRRAVREEYREVEDVRASAIGRSMDDWAQPEVAKPRRGRPPRIATE